MHVLKNVDDFFPKNHAVTMELLNSKKVYACTYSNLLCRNVIQEHNTWWLYFLLFIIKSSLFGKTSLWRYF